jgi:hypothetical protein
LCDIDNEFSHVAEIINTAQAWFAGHPSIGMAREPRGGYGEGASKHLPHAVRVADRHPLESARRAFPDGARKSMRQAHSGIDRRDTE